MSKETAKAVRQLIKKELNLSSRQVSVTNQYGGTSSAVYVNVKKLDIDLKPIEKLTDQFENYDRDQATGEILMGGNTYIFVQYHYDAE
jgi:hypothetical protein